LPSHCYPQELQGLAGKKFNHLAELSSNLEWYQEQHESLDAMVEALREDNSWLEYWLIGVEDAYTDQRTLTAEKAKEVDEVKAALQEKEGALATASRELQRARDALAEAQTALAQRETALAEALTQLLQDRTTLEGAWSWQTQAEQKAQEVEKLSVALQEKVTMLAGVEDQL
jgi:chromosome segregation ATPase